MKKAFGFVSQSRYATFLLLVACYLSVNAAKRWQSAVIFRGHGAYGWASPSYADYAHLLYSTAIPYFLVAAIAFLCGARLVNSRARLFIVGLLVYLGIILTEADMSWLQMSGRHIGLAEARVFITEDWSRTIGLRPSDLLRFLVLLCVHSAALLILGFIAVHAPERAFDQSGSGSRLRLIACLVVAAWLVDAVLVGRLLLAGNSQWIAFEARHQVRFPAIDRKLGSLTGVNDGLTELNRKFAVVEPVRIVERENPLAASVKYSLIGHPNIVVLAIEGLNYKIVASLPALQELGRSAISATNHYSTGDATHYGILGLTHGMPMFFYGKTPHLQSVYIDALNGAGYATRRFGTDVSSFGEMDAYTANFTRRADVPRDGVELISDVKSYLESGREPKFAIVYYLWTHWPYVHDPGYSRHQPEVPPDFNYGRWDLERYQVQIRNRYLNCLDEMNDWLTRFVSTIDRDKTILVVTADHGEEMFEHGRISHAGGVWDLQIHVPFYVLLPNASPQKITAVTSHAHVMPAILKWAGIPALNTAASYEGPLAIAAHNNHTAHPTEWGLITQDGKIRFTWSADNAIEIDALTDQNDDVLVEGLSGTAPRVDRLMGTLKTLTLENGAHPERTGER